MGQFEMEFAKGNTSTAFYHIAKYWYDLGLKAGVEGMNRQIDLLLDMNNKLQNQLDDALDDHCDSHQSLTSNEITGWRYLWDINMEPVTGTPLLFKAAPASPS